VYYWQSLSPVLPKKSLFSYNGLQLARYHDQYSINNKGDSGDASHKRTVQNSKNPILGLTF